MKKLVCVITLLCGTVACHPSTPNVTPPERKVAEVGRRVLAVVGAVQKEVIRLESVRQMPTERAVAIVRITRDIGTAGEELAGVLLTIDTATSPTADLFQKVQAIVHTMNRLVTELLGRLTELPLVRQASEVLTLLNDILLSAIPPEAAYAR